jgi:hypothetical protein
MRDDEADVVAGPSDIGGSPGRADEALDASTGAGENNSVGRESTG